MYLFLLVFGALLSLAGLVLSGSGISVQERAFNAAIVTPGIVAVIGGFVVIGLGLALRILRRIEKALAARPPRNEPAAEPAVSERAVDRPPVVPAARPARRLGIAATAGLAPTLPGDDKRSADLAAKLPDLVAAALRSDADKRLAEDNSALELPALPSAMAHLDETALQNKDFRAARRQSGIAPARATPRFDLNPQGASLSEPRRGPSFDTMWPRTQRLRPLQAAQAATVAAAVDETLPQPSEAPPPEDDGASVQDSLPTVPQDAALEAVTVLKTGVVDGMAYTLFSDGSIEAGLPQGTLRFGSITELRNHIEQIA